MKRVLTLVLTVLALSLPSAAHAQGAEATGWWSEFSTLPPAPDVGATDLLLQGGDPARLLPSTGVVDQSPAPSAFGAVRFHVEPGSAVGALQLAVASGGQATDVRAYPTTTPWKPAQNGALADAPTPDLGRYSSGRLDGDSLVFPDIGRLLTDGGDLSVVLLPGPADRVVVHAPTGAALTVVPPAPSAPEVAPPVTAPVPPVLPRADVPVLQPVAAPPMAAVPVPQAAPAPVAAPPPVVPVALPAAAARLVSDDNHARLVVLAEALLVLVFFGLLGQGPLALLAREEARNDVPRGIGRFQAVRVGRAPRL